MIVNGPDGLSVTFPDGTDANTINKVMGEAHQKHQAETQGLPASAGPQVAADGKVDANGSISAGSYAEDMAKSLGAGLVKGTESLAGGFGDIGRINGNLLAAGTRALGGGETAQDVARTVGRGLMGSFAMAPTTEQVKAATAPITKTANDFQPQTIPGKYAQTVGEFAPNAIAGEGGIAKKIVQTVVPALASEGAGQLAEKYAPALAPAARIAAAIVTGGAMGVGDAIAAKAANSKTLSNAAATRQGLVDAKNTAYTQAEQTLGKQEVPVDQFADLVSSMHSEGTKAGLGGAMSKTTNGLYPNSKNVLADAGDYLQKVSSGEAPPPTYADLEQIRQVLGDIKQSSKDIKGNISKDGYLAGKMQDLIDRAMGDNNPYQGAREAFQTMRKTQLIDQAISVGKEAASGPDNGIKLELQRLIKANVKKPQFSPAEIDAMKRATDGVGPLGLVTLLGKFGFSKEHVTSLVPGLGISEAAHAGHKAFGWPGAVAGTVGAAVGGNVAKRISTNARMNAATDARNVVALGGKGPALSLPSVSQKVLPGQALNALSAIQSSKENAKLNPLSELLYQRR